MYNVVENISLTLGVKKLDERAILPTKAHFNEDLGYDLYALEDTVLPPGQVTIVKTGIACDFPNGYGALLRDRSSISTKMGVFVVAGVIDQGYKGEVCVALHNPLSNIQLKYVSNPYSFSNDVTGVQLMNTKYIKAGDKIAQMILIPVISAEVVEVVELSESNRGANGFGSTGSR